MPSTFFGIGNTDKILTPFYLMSRVLFSLTSENDFWLVGHEWDDGRCQRSKREGARILLHFASRKYVTIDLSTMALSLLSLSEPPHVNAFQLSAPWHHRPALMASHRHKPAAGGTTTTTTGQMAVW